MDAKEIVLQLLKDNGCKKIRAGHLNVYRLPSGERFITPTHSTAAATVWKNTATRLKAKLGVSNRGKEAKQGEPVEHKPTKKKAKPPVAIEPAPPRMSFGDKVRVAVRGNRAPRGFERRIHVADEPKAPPTPSPEPAQHRVECNYQSGPIGEAGCICAPVVVEAQPNPEVATPSPEPIQEPIQAEPNRFGKKTIRKERERYAARVWTRAEVEAANTAMRAGKLDEYMQQYNEATHQTTPKPVEETHNMLSVEQVDATIRELDAGMIATLSQAKLEEQDVQRLEGELTTARERLQATHGKHNSLNDVKTSLLVLRDDIERVRPMLGLLAMKPEPATTTGTRTRTSSAAIAEAIKQIFEKIERPLQVREIHREILHIPGCGNVSRTSLYQFFVRDSKKNGDAIVHRVGPNLYWPTGRELPQGGARV